MQPLMDAIVDLVVADIVRGFELENAAVAPAKDNDRGVEDQTWKDYHSVALPVSVANATPNR